MSIDKVKYIKVFPGIGTARVGNSEQYFIGPENFGEVPNPGPGFLPNNEPSYKDSAGLIKPQAARFRVYGYDENDNVVMEILNDEENGIKVEWDVHMRNLKAANYAFQGKFAFKSADLRNPGVQLGVTNPNDRTQLIIDPGSKTISGNNATAVPLEGGSIFEGVGEADVPASLINKGEKGWTTVKYHSKKVSLGRLETDANGRLIVVGGKGDSGCLTEPPIIIQKGVAQLEGESTKNLDPTSNGNSYFNNPGWYDDTGGGSINATVIYQPSGPDGIVKTFGTDNQPEKRGWVAVSPPKYVPSMNNVVSLLDLQLDLFPDQDPVSGSLNYAVLGTDKLPYIAQGGNSTSFAPLNGISQVGTSAPSITSFSHLEGETWVTKQYYAYTTSDGVYLASSTDGVTWTGTIIQSGTPLKPVMSQFAPSLLVSNGLLTCVITSEKEGGLGGGYSIEIGTSTDGTTWDFNVITPGGGFGATTTNFAPSAASFNGILYLGVITGDGSISLGIQSGSDANQFTFNSITLPENSLGQSSLCNFFGELYIAYTGISNQCYIGNYDNINVPHQLPRFDFTKITVNQTSSFAPAIATSHGQLYFTAIGTGSEVFVASGKPGLTQLDFTGLAAISPYAPAIANFSSIEYYRDIDPILRTVTDYGWVNKPAFKGHSPGQRGDFYRKGGILNLRDNSFAKADFRRGIFRFIRPAEQLTPNVPPPPADFDPKTDIPTAITQLGTLMPHLYGEGGSVTENGFNKTDHPNQWLSLTPHQLWKFQEWVNGNFTMGDANATPTPLESLSLEDQTQSLNFSALEPTVGGGFHPGIELTYNMKLPGYFAAPFRFADNITDNTGTVVGAITPGSVAGYMSIPWQGDFWSCNISWWAAMRPDIVVLEGTGTPPALTHISWFRGEAVGIPHDADYIDGYEGGYEHMARYWSYFGFVVPTNNVDEGMIQLAESERAQCLDDASAPCVPVNPDAPQASIQLGVAQASKDSTGTGSFYTNTVKVTLPASGPIILASTNLATGDISVDDECVISVGDTQVYSHDFSNGNQGFISQLSPFDISSELSAYLGTEVSITVSYNNLYPPKEGGSDFWLCFPETFDAPVVIEPQNDEKVTEVKKEPKVEQKVVSSPPKVKAPETKQAKTPEPSFFDKLMQFIKKLFGG